MPATLDLALESIKFSKNPMLIHMRIAILAIALISGATKANTVSLEYSGTIKFANYSLCTENNGSMCLNWNSGSATSLNIGSLGQLSVDDKFSGRIIYDTDSSHPLFSSPSSTQANYLGNIKRSDFKSPQLSLPAETSQSYDGNIFVYKGRLGLNDLFGLLPYGAFNDWYLSPYLYFSDETGALISDYSIPDKINLNDLSISGFSLFFTNRPTGDQYSFSGIFDLLTFTKLIANNEIPEPPAFAMVLLGLIAGAVIKNRRLRNIKNYKESTSALRLNKLMPKANHIHTNQ